jgi:hypothetical protein
MRRIACLVPVVLALAVSGCAGMFDPFSSPDARSTANDLKIIGIALHSYHDTNGRLPIHCIARPAEPTKPLLSWRVAILPYIEQASLYQQFRHDEPWDSENNKRLIPLMPKVFMSRTKDAPEGHTYWQQLVGPGGVRPGSPWSFVRFTDGTSNTVAVAEAAEPVIWTKPADVEVPKEFAPGALKAKFAGQFNGGFFVLMWDGSVTVARDDADETALQRLFCPDDGQINNHDLWQRFGR